MLITRPLPQGERTAEKLRAIGYSPVLAPMLRIEPIAPQAVPDFTAVQAVLVTSLNGAERLAALTPLREFPVLAVGDRTADAAQDVGFKVVESASGDGTTLLAMARERLLPEAGPIIHIRGQHAAVEFGSLKVLGYDFQEIIAYEAVDQPELPSSVLSPIPAAALVYSPRTAQALSEAIRKANFDAKEMTIIGISAAALEPLSASKARLHAAKAPNEAALLATLIEITPPVGKN